MQPAGGQQPRQAASSGAHEVYAQLAGQLEAQRARLTEVLDGPVKAFGELVKSLELPPIAV